MFQARHLTVYIGLGSSNPLFKTVSLFLTFSLEVLLVTYVSHLGYLYKNDIQIISTNASTLLTRTLFVNEGEDLKGYFSLAKYFWLINLRYTHTNVYNIFHA